MIIVAIICAAILGAAASPPRPLYSSRYATVYRQGSGSERGSDAEELGVASGPPSRDESAGTPETVNTTERESEQIKDPEYDVAKDKLTEATEVEGLQEEAVYYIYHPDGLLQRVVYLARDDTQNMAYTAQFKYENIDLIREPVYTYDPETLVLQQLQR